MIEPRTLPGFMELLPQDQILFNKIQDVIRKNYERYGFLPLDTPVLESSDVLLAKAGGETEKQIYRFSKGDNDLCMRFDLTVPLAKYVASHINELNFPFARYQIGKVYRGERPQKGRFREFVQCDIDVIGKETLSLTYDALVPSVVYSIFKELDVGDFEIQISNRKLLMGLFNVLNLQEKSVDVLRLIDKFFKIGEENFIKSLNDLNLSENQINYILKFIKIDGTNQQVFDKLNELNINDQTFLEGKNELEQVTNYLIDFGVSQNNFKVKLSLTRGLDYYTGTVYETIIKGYEGLGSVCGGGRYENLAGYYTKTKLPGVGMAIGLTRLFCKLKENNIISSKEKSVSKAIIIPMGETVPNCIQISNKLRAEEINNTIYLQDSKFKAKMQYASKSQIRYAILVGEDEVKNGYYTLKDLYNFTQQQLSLDEIIKIIK